MTGFDRTRTPDTRVLATMDLSVYQIVTGKICALNSTRQRPEVREAFIGIRNLQTILIAGNVNDLLVLLDVVLTAPQDQHEVAIRQTAANSQSDNGQHGGDPLRLPGSQHPQPAHRHLPMFHPAANG